VSIREKFIVFIAVLETCHKKSFDLLSAMQIASDLALFRTLVISGILVGLIPLGKVKYSNLILTHRKFCRVWSPLIRIINIFVFPIMLVIRVLAVTKLSCDYSHFNHLVFQTCSFCYIIIWAATYVATGRFITRSLRLYKQLVEYDQTYWHMIHSSRKETILKFLFFLTLLAEPILNSCYILIRLVHLEKHKLSYTGIPVIDTGMSTAWMKIMYALCTIMIYYHVIFTLFSISLFSSMIQTRLCQIRETLANGRQRTAITPCGGGNLNSVCFMNNVNNILQELQHLQDIFLFFKNTIKWMLFLFISHVTIVLPMLLYYARTSLAVYGMSSPFISITVMVHIVVTLVKTISLTNSGERILDAVREVRRDCCENHNNEFVFC